jgi:hypothetical protein
MPANGTPSSRWTPETSTAMERRNLRYPAGHPRQAGLGRAGMEWFRPATHCHRPALVLPGHRRSRSGPPPDGPASGHAFGQRYRRPLRRQPIFCPACSNSPGPATPTRPVAGFPLPDNVNIYRFSRGNVFNDGVSESSPIPRMTNCASTTRRATPSGPVKRPLAAARSISKPHPQRHPHQRPDLPDPALVRGRS